MNPPHTVEDIITDFKGRRSGIIKALTKDFNKFYQQCDPNQPSLCLYTYPNQHWRVTLPPTNLEFPEPKSGINFLRDVMSKYEWLSMVAMQSDAWLNAVATWFTAFVNLDKSDRKYLFNRITDFSPVWEIITCENKIRVKKFCIDSIFPQELFVELISRLPVRDVVRCRSVCKKWLCLINDPGFVLTHLRNYRNDHLLVIESSKYLNSRVMVCCSDTFSDVMELKNRVSDGQGISGGVILGYVNGVILIEKKNLKTLESIILWNPSINKSISITNLPLSEVNENGYYNLSLGYDALNNDIKVVAIVYPHVESSPISNIRYRGKVRGFVQVYTLSTKSWNTYDGVYPPPYWSRVSNVFFNGRIHWPNMGPRIRDDDSWTDFVDSHILSFDISNEVFDYFECPKEVVEDPDSEREVGYFPIVLDGLFGMFYEYISHCEVWVMEEYGVPASWNKRYKFELQIKILFYFKSNGELLYASNEKGIKSYDANRKSVKDYAKENFNPLNYTIYTYVESLLLHCK